MEIDQADLNEAMQEHLMRQKQQLDDDSEPVYSDEDEMEVLAEPKQRVNFKRIDWLPGLLSLSDATKSEEQTQRREKQEGKENASRANFAVKAGTTIVKAQMSQWLLKNMLRKL